MAKVSVIVPVYNVEQYLEEALRSLVRQTLRDIEIVVVNDGSTDGSLDIIKRFMEQDDRIVLIDKENGGYGKAMNVGLDRASGEYIGILEPDDYVPLDMYEDLYETAAANDLDMIKADFYRFTTDDNSGNVHMYYNHLDSSAEHYNMVLDPSEDPSLTKFIMNTWRSTTSVIMRRRVPLSRTMVSSGRLLYTRSGPCSWIARITATAGIIRILP